MTVSEFRKFAHHVADWMADYFETIEKFPVKSNVEPREIYNQIPDSPPEHPEDFEKIFQDFLSIILPGITHWQHPSFFAYFPANASFPSVLAEMLTATLATQGMLWDTSPAAAELEEKMMEWLKQSIGLPDIFQGVIYDGASTATLSAIISAREKVSGFLINISGFKPNHLFRVYASEEAHSSVEKAVKMAGIGRNNLVKIPTDENFLLLPNALEQAIEDDLSKGYIPLCVVATLGTTSCTAIDPLDQIAPICAKYKLWMHIDAAYAGSALILPEYRWMIKGIEQADSFVFNPHKWLMTNFDCTAFFIKDKEVLLQAFSILPEYLKTQWATKVNNYSDWGPQLGRRFRALKLWFVLRSYGVSQLRQILRRHILLARMLEEKMRKHPDVEILAPVNLNLICFRATCSEYKEDEDKLNQLNQNLLTALNKSGKLYLSHTKLKGKFTLRMVIGQTNVQESHIEKAWQEIQSKIKELVGNLKI
ncbi:MAG: aspartate aminotransferase family protein [Sphingobacteriales bacterium]|nr:MAG: aspartate aminotransferase family protein [Sphingobacteriales bacterium]